MYNSLSNLVEHTEPLGTGVTSIVFPALDAHWVIKLALAHDQQLFDSFDRAHGWDCFRDRRPGAHCSLFDRLA
jgi:hypothetical protein